MTLEEYRRIWQQQPSGEPEPLDEEVLTEVKDLSEKYDRKLFWRDVREIGASVLVAGFFGYLALTAEPLLARVGAGVVVAGAALVVWKLRRARTDGQEELAGRPVAERLRAEIEKVDAQIELLESVVWWYLSPLVLGLVLVVAADGIDGWGGWAYLAAVFAFAGFVRWLNHRAVERTHRPRREKLTRLLRRLEAGEPAGRPD